MEEKSEPEIWTLDLSHVCTLVAPVFVGKRVALVHLGEILDTTFASEDLPGGQIEVAHLEPGTSVILLPIDIARAFLRSNGRQMRWQQRYYQALDDCQSGVASYTYIAVIPG
jgi:hypothetical protein